MALLQHSALPLSLNIVVYKLLLKQRLQPEDVRNFDPVFYKNVLQVLLAPDGLERLKEALCVEEELYFVDYFGDCGEEPELVPNGRKKIVTEANKLEFVLLLAEEKICGGVRNELGCFLSGFWSLVPLPVLRRSGVSPQDLCFLIQGLEEDLDVELWFANTRLEGDFDSARAKRCLRWFVEILLETTPEARARVLHFVTGSSRLPPGGFRGLSAPFTVSFSFSKLPPLSRRGEVEEGEDKTERVRVEEEEEEEVLPGVLSARGVSAASAGTRTPRRAGEERDDPRPSRAKSSDAANEDDVPLPIAHTCMNMLVLSPDFATKEELRRKLGISLTNINMALA